jgi:hypothetical protein
VEPLFSASELLLVLHRDLDPMRDGVPLKVWTPGPAALRQLCALAASPPGLEAGTFEGGVRELYQITVERFDAAATVAWI